MAKRNREGQNNPNWRGGPVLKPCAACGIIMSLAAYIMRERRYCSIKCRAVDQGKERSGESSPNWRGGRILTPPGYVMALNRSHPRASCKGYVFEHILVAEKNIGRYLKRGEIVHHINENKADNRPQNLMVLPDRAAHAKIHADKRIIDIGGDPTKHKICGSCGLLKRREEYQSSAGKPGGLLYQCKACCYAKYRIKQATLGTK